MGRDGRRAQGRFRRRAASCDATQRLCLLPLVVFGLLSGRLRSPKQSQRHVRHPACVCACRCCRWRWDRGGDSPCQRCRVGHHAAAGAGGVQGTGSEGARARAQRSRACILEGGIPDQQVSIGEASTLSNPPHSPPTPMLLPIYSCQAELGKSFGKVGVAFSYPTVAGGTSVCPCEQAGSGDRLGWMGCVSS